MESKINGFKMKKSYILYGTIASLLTMSLVLTPMTLQTVNSQESMDLITVLGGGRTIIVGGDGGMIQGDPSLPTPIMTILSFQATKDDDQVKGFFECLALMPRKAESFKPLSGTFSINAMYVTGTVTDLEIDGDMATISGKATITGVGAGRDLDFTFVVQEGGPGSFMHLTTQNPEHGKEPLVFRELLIEGEVKFKV